MRPAALTSSGNERVHHCHLPRRHEPVLHVLRQEPIASILPSGRTCFSSRLDTRRVLRFIRIPRATCSTSACTKDHLR